MAAFLALFLVSIVAAVALACAINFFLRLGPWRSLGYALIGVGMFLIFCMTGVWEGANRHDWGPLAPVFALMLFGGWACIKFGKHALKWWRSKKDE